MAKKNEFETMAETSARNFAAMAEPGKYFFRPQRTDLKLNLDRGTLVEVLTGEGLFEGTVAQNPVDAGSPKFLELHLVEKIIGKPPNQQRKPEGFMRIDVRDVHRVKVIKQKSRVTVKAHTERLFHTIIISTQNELLRFMKSIENVTEVGLNLYGTYVGRDGIVGWITLFFGDTLVCIDALELSTRLTTFWDKLNVSLFGNERILKVMYNSRPIVDYLYHQHSIEVNNIDDLQVCEFEAWMLGQSIDKLKGNRNALAYKPLSEMIETFIFDVPRGEVRLLQDFEAEDFSMTSPLMARPIQDTKYCKCIAIEMKYLLTLRKTFESLLLRKKNYSVSCQAEEMKNAGSDKMERQKKYPLQIPDNVLKHSLRPVGHWVEFRQMNGNTLKRK